MINIFSSKKILAFAAFGLINLIAIHAHDAYGQAMSSTNYKIESDSLNVGGARGASTGYRVEDTLGESATGVSSSESYVMNAGYQQMHASVISITNVENVVMTPSINGVTGGVSNGETAFIVTTDNSAGYSVTIKASSSPALVSGSDSFSDYVPQDEYPDFSFMNDTTGSSFAFSPEGDDISVRYKNDGVSSCGTGSNTTGACFDGLSTSPKTIALRTSSNHPSGTGLTIKFRAASGSAHVQPDGNYVATTTVTALPL